MKAIIVLTLLALFGIQSISCMTYSSSLVGSGKAGATCPTIGINGAIQWVPQTFAGACANPVAKYTNSLFVTGSNGDLSFCDGVPRGQSGADPVLLLQKSTQHPSYLLTRATANPLYQNGVDCDDCNANGYFKTQLDFKNYLFNIELSNNNLDAMCQAEFGVDYVAAQPQDAAFALDGRSSVLANNLQLADRNPAIAAHVRGATLFWMDSADTGSLTSYSWQLGVLWADSLGGRGSAKITPFAGTYLCDTDNVWAANRKLYFEGGPAPPRGPAPVLCRRKGIEVESLLSSPNTGELYTPSTVPTCAKLLGLGYNALSLSDLQREIKAPFVPCHSEYSYSFCPDTRSTSYVLNNGNQVLPTVADSGAFYITSTNGRCLAPAKYERGLYQLTCSRTPQFLATPIAG